MVRRARASRGGQRSRPLTRHNARDKRGLPGVTRDWNAPAKAGAPLPKESLLEFQAWKESVRTHALLKAGLPLPPPEAPLALLGAPATADAPPPAAVPTPAPPKRCTLRTAGVTRQQFLASLDAACQIDWGDAHT